MSDRNWLREVQPPRAAAAVGPLPVGIDASAIVSGVLAPERMGSGASNSGGLVLHDDGVWRAPSGGGGGTRAATLNAPYSSIEHTETVIDDDCTPTTRLTVGWGNTSEDDENTPTLEPLLFAATPQSGKFDVTIVSADRSPFGGAFNIHYSLG